MDIRFACPECGRAGRVDPVKTAEWQCLACGRVSRFNGPVQSSQLHSCLVCGNQELYKKKDFPHWLGLTILTVACLGSIVPYYLYHQWLTWTILIGSAVVDGLLYLWVGDSIVCYRCDSQFRGFETLDGHRPFDLGIGERYRQEQIRREQLRAASRLS
jgi:hypothetical protein